MYGHNEFITNFVNIAVALASNVDMTSNLIAFALTMAFLGLVSSVVINWMDTYLDDSDMRYYRDLAHVVFSRVRAPKVLLADDMDLPEPRGIIEAEWDILVSDWTSYTVSDYTMSYPAFVFPT